MQTNRWLILGALAATTACISVKQSAEPEPSGDASLPPQASASVDATAIDRSETDSEPRAVDAGSDTGPGCSAGAAPGFCENFDETALPGAFEVMDQTKGNLALISSPVTSGAKAMRSNLPPSQGGLSVARLYKKLANAQTVEIEFDFLPEKVSGNKGQALLTQLHMAETDGSGVVGGVEIADEGEGGVFLTVIRYNNKGDVSQKVGSPYPVILDEWKRLRFTFTLAGEMGLYDVTKKVDILPLTKVPMPDKMQVGVGVILGAECPGSHQGFSLLYDSVVVRAK
jgi:hypothetical protein